MKLTNAVAGAFAATALAAACGVGVVSIPRHHVVAPHRVLASSGPTPVSAPSWTAATLTGGWTNAGAPYFVAGFRQDNGREYLRGVICGQPDAVGQPALTLPTNSRPSHELSLGTVATNGDATNLEVDPSGAVTPKILFMGCVDLGVVNFDLLP